MNLYVRYFDHEILAHNMDEIAEFLYSIREINTDQNALNRIHTFWESSNVYPYRLKVSYSNYVLFLKTEAKDLAEFKLFEQMRKENKTSGNPLCPSEKKRSQLDILNEPNEGWYEASLQFKRVVQMRDTNKCQYKDTRFRVRLKATSAMDCYNRIVEHLRNRQDVDPRSQFPSAKSSNFNYKFLDTPAKQEPTEQQAETQAEQEPEIQQSAEESQNQD